MAGELLCFTVKMSLRPDCGRKSGGVHLRLAQVIITQNSHNIKSYSSIHPLPFSSPLIQVRFSGRAGGAAAFSRRHWTVCHRTTLKTISQILCMFTRPLQVSRGVWHWDFANDLSICQPHGDLLEWASFMVHPSLLNGG